MSNLPIELKNQIDEIFSETNTILLEDNFLGDNMTNITVYYKNNKPIFLLYNSDGNKIQTAFFPSTSNLKIDDLNQIENVKLYFENKLSEKISLSDKDSFILSKEVEKEYLNSINPLLL